MIKNRSSGLLLPIFSIPSRFGIGDLGKETYQFTELLSTNEQYFWQILPLNPTELQHGNSPYHSCSAFAGNPLLISPELLYQDGLLKKSELESSFVPEKPKIDFARVYSLKQKLLEKACAIFPQLPKLAQEFDDFCYEQSYWLDDYALFEVLRLQFPNKQWNKWPISIRDRDISAMAEFRKKRSEELKKYKIIQFLFFRQWYKFKKYCSSKNIKIIGDMPIYVTYHSAEVWAHSELFKLDKNKSLLYQAGVPPDYFSSTGQLWGNPVYRWSSHRKEKFNWWQKRISHNLALVDLLRIDHFRGLVAYWEIAANEKTAIHGKWVTGGGRSFFQMLQREFPELPFIAEDLGVITEDVVQIINQLGLPGMRVLLFAFDDTFPHSPYLPHNHIANCVVYTGTHDNNTIKGWWQRELKPSQRRLLERYLGKTVRTTRIHWDLIRMAQASVANLAIIPVQDILGLGAEARINNPAQTHSNWQWRLTTKQMLELKDDALPQLKELTQTYGRAKL